MANLRGRKVRGGSTSVFALGFSDKMKSVAAAAAVLSLATTGTVVVQAQVAPSAMAQEEYVSAADGLPYELRDTRARYARISNMGDFDDSDGADVLIRQSNWNQSGIGFKTSSTNPKAGQAYLHFNDPALYSQIDRIHVYAGENPGSRDYGAMEKLDSQGSEWAIPVEDAMSMGLGTAYNSYYRIWLKDGVELSDLEAIEGSFTVDSFWTTSDGLIAAATVSSTLVNPNPETGIEYEDRQLGMRDWLSTGVGQRINYDQGESRIKSTRTFLPVQNYKQASYDWSLLIKEQIDPRLVPYIESVQVYNSDQAGNISRNRGAFDMHLDPDTGLVTSEYNPQLSWLHDEEKLTSARWGEVRDNVNDVFWGTLGQSRSFTIDYKLKDGAVDSVSETMVKKLLSGENERVEFDFVGWLESDLPDTRVLGQGGLTDNGAPPRRVQKSDSSAYLEIKDTDGDGLTDDYERSLGLDPQKPDTDGDGIPDGVEVVIDGTDATKAESYLPGEPKSFVKEVSSFESASEVEGQATYPTYPDPADPEEDLQPRSQNIAPLKIIAVPESAVDEEGAVDQEAAIATVSLDTRPEVENGKFSLEIPQGTEAGTYRLVAVSPNGETTVGDSFEVTDEPEEESPVDEGLDYGAGATIGADADPREAQVPAPNLDEEVSKEDGDKFLFDESKLPEGWQVDPDDQNKLIKPATDGKDDQITATIDPDTGEITVEAGKDASAKVEIPVKLVDQDDKEKSNGTVPVQVEANTGTMADDYKPAYEPKLVEPGQAITLEQTAELPEDVTFSASDGSDVKVAEDGTVTITAPEDAVEGTVISSTITVTYPDGSTNEVPVVAIVKDKPVEGATDAQTHSPGYTPGAAEAGESVTLKQDGDTDLPAGTEFSAGSDNVTVDPSTGEATLVIPEGATPGEPVQGTVVVTYPDGSTQEIPVFAVVKDEPATPPTMAEENNPSYLPGSGGKGDSVTIEQTGGTDLPEGTTFTPGSENVTVDSQTGKATIQVPDDAEPGSVITGTVEVNYPDGSSVEIPVSVVVQELGATDAQKYTPGYEPTMGVPNSNVKIKQTGEQDLPEGTSFAAASDNVTVDSSTGEVTMQVPAGAKPGEVIKGEVMVTFPDGSEKQLPVYTVAGVGPHFEGSKDSVEPGDKDVALENSGGDLPDGATVETEGPGKAELDEDGNIRLDVDEGAKPGDKITVIVKDGEGNELDRVQVVVIPVPENLVPGAEDPADCDIEPFVTVTDIEGITYEVTVDGEEVERGEDGKYVYPYGKTVIVKALDSEGEKIDQWSWTAPTRDVCEAGDGDTLPSGSSNKGKGLGAGLVTGGILGGILGSHLGSSDGVAAPSQPGAGQGEGDGGSGDSAATAPQDAGSDAADQAGSEAQSGAAEQNAQDGSGVQAGQDGSGSGAGSGSASADRGDQLAMTGVSGVAIMLGAAAMAMAVGGALLALRRRRN